MGWELSPCKEDGWKCYDCGEKFGFRPDFDKKYLFWKVYHLMHNLHGSDLIYISNGSQGDCMTQNVMHRCEEEKVYDQYSIILFIMQEPNMDTKGHAEFWSKESKRFLRNRKKYLEKKEAEKIDFPSLALNLSENKKE